MNAQGKYSGQYSGKSQPQMSHLGHTVCRRSTTSGLQAPERSPGQQDVSGLGMTPYALC